MTDRDMPDYQNEPNEWDSNRPVALPQHILVQVKSYSQRLQMAHTVQALLAVRHDIEQGALGSNQSGKEQLRHFANARAHDMGFKGEWWQQ